MNKFGNFVVGFLLGATAGSVISLLYAPTDGKHTRDKLSYHLSRLQEMLNNLMQKREELVNEAKTQGAANVSKTQLEAKKLQDDIANIQKKIKQTQAK